METQLDARPIICIHGYGVRGFFWEGVKTQLEKHFHRVMCPDLLMIDIESAIDEIVTLASAKSAELGQPVILLGHSLGGVLCSMAASKLQEHEIDSLIILASPYGERRSGINPVIKFLLRHRLIPGWMVRGQFFGPATPVQLQKSLFDKAVPESPLIQDAIAQPKWFHSDAVNVAYHHHVLGIASSCDKIVSHTETQEFTNRLGGKFILFPTELEIGHDDFTVHKPAIKQLLAVLLPFLGKEYLLPSADNTNPDAGDDDWDAAIVR